jgi:hypothetical protein
MTPQTRSERTTALFLLGVLALSPPFLAIFGAGVLFLGVPLLYFYLFAVWALLIGLLALISRGREVEGRPQDARGASDEA